MGSVLIVLQHAPLELRQKTDQTEGCKAQLRQSFLALGRQVADQLQRQGYRADLFDPGNGLPLLSRAGASKLDDVAVVQACLGYGVVSCNGCRVILHPQWGSAVYPSILVSSALPDQLRAVVSCLLSA